MRDCNRNRYYCSEISCSLALHATETGTRDHYSRAIKAKEKRRLRAAFLSIS
jgi:hypothetical protein